MKHRTFLNLSALKFPTILVSGDRRGFSIVIGSRNYWRRSGSDHRYRNRQPASEWLLRAGGVDENQRRQKTRRCRRHREERATERKMGGEGSVITVHPAHLPVGLGVETELSPLIPR